MKKLIMTALGVLSCTMIEALPIGNPGEASLVPWGVVFPRASERCRCNPCFYWFDIWSVRAGYYGDFVNNRRLKLSGNGFDHGKHIEKTEIVTNAAYLALNLADRVDFFGTVGATNINITTNEVSWEVLANSVSQLHWKSTFSWSAGARGTIFGCKGFLLGVEGQYFQTRPKFTRFVNLTGEPQYQYFNNNTARHMWYRECQVGTGISYVLTSFRPNISLVPYAGIKWAWSRFITHNFSFTQVSDDTTVTIFNLKSARTFGYAVGISGTFCDMVCLTAEGRWGDEKAFYINGNFRF